MRIRWMFAAALPLVAGVVAEARQAAGPQATPDFFQARIRPLLRARDRARGSRQEPAHRRRAADRRAEDAEGRRPEAGRRVGARRVGAWGRGVERRAGAV